MLAVAAGALVVLVIWTLATGGARPLPVRSLYAALIAASLLGAGAAFAVRGLDRAGPLVACLSFAALLGNTRAMASSDTLPASVIPVALVRDGALTLRGFEPFHTEGRTDLVPLANGRFASKYPVGTALLALPIALPYALGGAPLEARILTAIQKVAAAALAAATVALLFLAFRRIASERIALVSAALVLFGTATLPILGQALWQHTGAALCLAAGAAALVVLREDRSLWRAGLTGFCAGAALACRPSDLPLAAALVAALIDLDRRRSRIALCAAAFALPLLLTFAYNAATFGHWLKTGYGTESSTGWRPIWPDGAEGLAGLLASPARGLFVASPILLAAAAFLAWPPRDTPRRRPLRWLALGAAGQALLMARWWAWSGMFSAGPRMLSDAIPFLALGIPILMTAALRSRSRKAALVAVALLSVASVIPNLLLAYSNPPPQGRKLVWELAEGPWSLRAYPPIAWVQR